MKKLLTALLALCLMLTACGALAEETANVINWSDIEPQIAEAGWQGEFVTFDEIAVKLWIPSGMSSFELTDEDRENGYIGYFATEDQAASVSVFYVDADGMDIETYAQTLPDVGGIDIETGILNDLPVVTYAVDGADAAYMAVATEAGYILEVALSPMSDEGFAAVASIIFASFQNA